MPSTIIVDISLTCSVLTRVITLICAVKRHNKIFDYVKHRNVEDLIKFPGQKALSQLTYAAKQLIAREVGVLRL